jgi:hypothetical protein
VEVLRKWTVALTDQCFEDVARLPGQQVMHRLVHAEFLTEQFQNFLRQAEGDIFVFDSPPAAKTEVEKLIAQVREGLDHDLHDFQAGLWRPRAKEKETSVTNIVNINGPNMGIVQQAGDGSTQTATIEFNASSVEHALEEFVAALNVSDVPAQIKRDAMIEIESIRPQLKKNVPNASIVREGLHTLRNIVEGVTAGLLTSKLVAVLVAAGMALS